MEQRLAGPVAEGERIAVLDMLRGFALLGIFLINVEWFARPLQDMIAGVGPGEGLDGQVGALVYLLVQGKFWVLFSLLFGMGFALMHQRAEAAGRPFIGLYLRRSLLLALFGLVHIAFVWTGDVLFTYALASLGLLAFLPVRGPALWLAGLGLYVAVPLLSLLGGLALGLLPASALAPVQEDMRALAAAGQAAAAVYREGDFLAVSAQRWAEYFGWIFPQATLYHLPMALGCFLIGAWLLRSGRLADLSAQRGFFLALAIGGGLAGGALLALGASLGLRFDPVAEFPRASLASGLMMLGNLPLSLAYLALFLLLASLPGPRRLFGLLAPAGRMALTNYLAQTLLCSLVFYGYGLGVFDAMGRTAQLGFVVLVFTAQLLFSHAWLARFRFGPLEWLWRAGTYLRLPPLRR